MKAPDSPIHTENGIEAVGTSLASVGVIFPTGMLGGGFSREMVRAGIEMGATAIAVDGGSTDSGPYYLGSGTPKTTTAAVERDLRILLVEARCARIPLLVGSCGTSGTDSGVEWVADMAARIAREERLSFRLACIYSEQSPEEMVRALHAGRVHPLPPCGPLDEATLRSCSHIVGLMGHEPFVAAMRAGADVVLAGRATDTSMVAAVGLMRGLPAGPAWHAAKTVECAGLCTTTSRGTAGSGPVYVVIDANGFTVTPLNPEAACTPMSVAAHMLYENTDPIALREPPGTLDTSAARYVPLDDRSVRVEGSRFEESAPTIKLEGSALVGYETISLVGISDPNVLARLDVWIATFTDYLNERVHTVLGLDRHTYKFDLRCYGLNAVLGPLQSESGAAPREVGMLLKVRAEDQGTATAIARLANPAMLHLPLPGMTMMPSYAFATSPPEIERGPAYEFVLNHVVDVDRGEDLFRTQFFEVHHG
jgi:Acyclic terpene utilisation family protein AtuA